MICKHCQHNNQEANRFCGMCGQPLPRPQSNAGSAATTTTASQANGRATGSLGLRDTPKQMGTLPPLGSRPQSAAPVSTDKKVQFPPIASPPQPSRGTAPVTAGPGGSAAGSGALNGTAAPGTTAGTAPGTNVSGTNERRTVPQPSAAGAAEKRGPFPWTPLGPQQTPLGPQPVTATNEVSAEKKIRAAASMPLASPSPQSVTPEQRAQNQPSYSQSSESRPLTADAFDRPASAQKPAAPESRKQTQSLDASAFDRPTASDKSAVSERRTQPVSSPQRPAAAVIPPAKRAQASAQVRVSGPSFLGLSDDPPEETSKDSDDLYKTHWGGRIAVVFLILAIAGGLAYLQWRSGHPLQAASQTAAPQPPTAARVDSTAGESSGAAAAPGTNNATNPPAASTQSGNTPEANHRNAGSNGAGATQPAAGSNQSANQAKADTNQTAAAKTANAANAKAAPQTDSIREGHEVAGKSQEDLEEPVRLAESYIQGRGVAQNCNAALGILRNASDRGNPRAEIKLGALYATGNCVAPDRVAAYRHFSRAIAAQPNNVWLEQSRSRLWSDMSAAERQQAMEVEK